MALRARGVAVRDHPRVGGRAACDAGDQQERRKAGEDRGETVKAVHGTRGARRSLGDVEGYVDLNVRPHRDPQIGRDRDRVVLHVHANGAADVDSAAVTLRAVCEA
jgi:hypothetical protein